MASIHPFPVLTAEEAAAQIPHGATVGFSGFGAAGSAKVVPKALAARAREIHDQGRPFRIRVLTGASTDENLDEVLARAEAISWRAPYQASPTLRDQINRQEVEYVDMHLSHMPQSLAFGFLGRVDFAVIEATEVTRDGRVYLSTSIGASPTFLHHAEQVIIEVNRRHFTRLSEMADITILPPPLQRSPIPIQAPMTRIGWPYALVEPNKVIGIVETDEPDQVAPFAPPDEASRRIARHVVEFLLCEVREGRVPREFLPLQSGVGNVANAVMITLGAHPDVPPFTMYSEVYQDALVELMQRGKLLGASATGLILTHEAMKTVCENMDFFASRIILRPQEISNHPGIIRRLGVIAMNTALEVDIYGNVNSTHVCGQRIMNGVGGSGEFTRNSYISVFMCPSITRGGKISTVVPMCPHVDNNEHSVQIIVTEQGLADIRGMGPMQRAQTIIERCAHPAYRDYLHRYVREAPLGHIRHDLSRCFQLHQNLMEHGTMLPGVEISDAS
jgi:acetyl-CoA hydrolase